MIAISSISIAIPAHAQDCEPQETAQVRGNGNNYENFGGAVSIDGDCAIVGARGDNRRGDYAGAAHIYERIEGEWHEVADLLATDALEYDEFGGAVAVHGAHAIVGAIGEDDRGATSGSAYVFERIDGDWIQAAKLTASDGEEWDRFGAAVAISNNVIIITAYTDDDRGNDAGAAYVFEKMNGEWTEVAKLTASDGATEDYFGISVALDGTTVIIGAQFDDDNGSNSGSAYIFERVDGVWMETAKLTASDGAPDDFFATNVAIDGDTAVVGAFWDDDQADGSGSAYVFERLNGIWLETESAKLTASDAEANDNFCRVAIDGDTIVVGADGDDGDSERDYGAAYLFRRSGDGWTEVDKIVSSEGNFAHIFGNAVSVSGNTCLIGERGNNSLFVGAGAAYFFDLNCSPSRPALSILGTCPGPMRFKAEGATSNGRVAYLYARGEGAVIIPPGNPCAGTQLGLNATVQLAGVERADENGIARLDVENVPNAACGRIYLQAIDLTTCATTNVIGI